MSELITIDIDKPWGTVDRSVTEKKLGVIRWWFPIIKAEWYESPNGRTHLDLELDMGEYDGGTDQIDAMLILIRMYMGDDGRRCRTDVRRYFERGWIRCVLRHKEQAIK